MAAGGHTGQILSVTVRDAHAAHTRRRNRPTHFQFVFLISVYYYFAIFSVYYYFLFYYFFVCVFFFASFFFLFLSLVCDFENIYF